MRTDGIENRDIFRLQKDCQKPQCFKSNGVFSFLLLKCAWRAGTLSEPCPGDLICSFSFYLCCSLVRAVLYTSKYRLAQKTTLESMQWSLRMVGMEWVVPTILGLKKKGEREKWKERHRSCFLLGEVGAGFTCGTGWRFKCRGGRCCSRSPEPGLPASWPPQVSVYTNGVCRSLRMCLLPGEPVWFWGIVQTQNTLWTAQLHGSGPNWMPSLQLCSPRPNPLSEFVSPGRFNHHRSWSHPVPRKWHLDSKGLNH